MHKLVNEKTGKVLKVGTKVRDFRGEAWTLVDFSPPKHEGSTGRVQLRGADGAREWFYPTVINAKIVGATNGHALAVAELAAKLLAHTPVPMSNDQAIAMALALHTDGVR